MELLSSSLKPPSGPLVAVIPAFNEERFIGSVVLTARNYCDVVIVVDDGSSDRTADLAEAAGARVVQRRHQGGKGAALNTGFEEALRYSPSAAVVLDGDAQHDPAEIVQVAHPVLEGQADVVVGSRFLTRERGSIPWWRQLGQVALTIATNNASGVHLTDSQTGYRAFSAEAMRQIRFQSQGLSAESEMQFILKDSALRLTEVPIHVRYLDGSKRNPISHGLSVLDTIIALVARKRPLLFFSAPGACLVVTGLIMGYDAFGSGQVPPHAVPALPESLATLFLIVGLLFGVTGTILNAFEQFASRVSRELGEISRSASGTSSQEVVQRFDAVGNSSRQL